MTKRMIPDTHDIVNRYVLVIDTETTGLPKGRGVTSESYEKWNGSRLVQIAWELFNPSKLCVDKQSYIVIPNGFEIPEVVVNIHGISTERATEEGIPLENVIKLLHTLIKYNPIIVAHNMQFDNDIILAELYRALNTNSLPSIQDILPELITLWIECEKHCTMLMGTLPGQKWPKLVALYERCFNRLPSGEMHRADNDTRACAEIYFHLLEQLMNNP